MYVIYGHRGTSNTPRQINLRPCSPVSRLAGSGGSGRSYRSTQPAASKLVNILFASSYGRPLVRPDRRRVWASLNDFLRATGPDRFVPRRGHACHLLAGELFYYAPIRRTRSRAVVAQNASNLMHLHASERCVTGPRYPLIEPRASVLLDRPDYANASLADSTRPVGARAPLGRRGMRNKLQRSRDVCALSAGRRRLSNRSPQRVASSSNYARFYISFRGGDTAPLGRHGAFPLGTRFRVSFDDPLSIRFFDLGRQLQQLLHLSTRLIISRARSFFSRYLFGVGFCALLLNTAVPHLFKSFLSLTTIS